jgi:ABC-2 type transport system ATP-binding protein
MLVVKNFSKSYGADLVLALEGFVCRPGVHLIKGENGSGKTTFFKSLAGIVPCQGEISIHETSLRKDEVAYRYLVNFAEAEPLFPGFLTAKDLIRFIGKIKKATTQQEQKYTRELGVDAFFEKSCETYSSGMLKKLSLVLAFLGDPKMIILDEPLITLDEQTRLTLFQIIAEKNETIFMISSHQPVESQYLKIDSTFKIQQKTLVPE